MFPLRRLSLLARLVLAGWLLSLGAAIAAPALQRQALEVVCAGGAMKLVVVGDDGAGTPLPSAPGCPLCLPAIAPPPPALVAAASLLPAFDPPAVRGAAMPLVRSAAPLPARGPPGFPLSA